MNQWWLDFRLISLDCNELRLSNVDSSHNHSKFNHRPFCRSINTHSYPTASHCSGRCYHLHINSFGPRRSRRQFADEIFISISLDEEIQISSEIPLKFIPNGLINNNPTLVRIMAWHWPVVKPPCEPTVIILLTHKRVTRPQRVKPLGLIEITLRGEKCVIALRRHGGYFIQLITQFRCNLGNLLHNTNVSVELISLLARYKVKINGSKSEMLVGGSLTLMFHSIKKAFVYHSLETRRSQYDI